ncbi:hypothetical protein MSG28_003752 [Choristoneura fumiferana]|uniref:Uncharacterized protein n=1 Tax=Choristoneura fumiferana TaxID=7141 RepID=A0ACC0KG64_CHOFU|nr:hypothetical protein MSG28_003752 [Choristoneura fumiferana]
MPKRLSDRESQKILKYQQKIRKIQKSSSEDSSDSDGNDLVEVFVEEPYEEPEIVHEADPGAPTISVLKEPDPEPQLDPDLLTALGETVDDSPQYGPHIHTNLAQRWQPILKKGLPKETKEKLLKTYLIPENCTLLQAPKINAEISAAVLDVVRNRDKKIEAAQQQLGAGITAINKGLTILLTSEDKVTATKHLSDACRILSDLHYMETQTRAKLVTPALSKQFLNVIQDCERDETLFGAKLPEKIKASKAIEKQGLQIKKIVKSTTGTSSAPTAPRAGYQGNWTAPSRYPSSRGGEEARGEQHRRRRAGRPPCRSRGRRARANHVQCSTKQAEKADMQLAIQNLKDLGAITICSPSRDQYLSKIFLTPKPNGAKRFILNLKNLNKFVEKAHFKMEDYRTAARIIPKGGFMATIDLKEAYLLIPIAKPDRRQRLYRMCDKCSTYCKIAGMFGFIINYDKSSLKPQQCTISYINRMGGVQFPHLNNLARQIWQWCEMRNIWLFASYINTRDNTEADEESRKLNPDTEWELSDLAFQKIIDHFGQPEVDLFASRANAKCQTYVSWKRDPEAFCIDAFTINWSQKFFYAFPPFSEPAPAARAAYPGCCSALRLAFSRLGVPAVSQELMMASLSKNTLQQYNTSAAGRSQPILFLPYFREKPNICPATVLRDYIALTRDIRPENALNLLLTVKRPFKCATAQTIGRWIKQVMAESGVDVTAFGAHSTRHAATSAAAAAGVSVDTIRKTASWTNNSQAFAKFYHRQIIDEGSFARAEITEKKCNVASSAVYGLAAGAAQNSRIGCVLPAYPPHGTYTVDGRPEAVPGKPTTFRGLPTIYMVRMEVLSRRAVAEGCDRINPNNSSEDYPLYMR